jgi:ribose 5-phosphate isomerase B
MKIYIGADHRGFEAKMKIKDYLTTNSYWVQDVGDERLEPEDDFPQFAGRCANAVLSSDDPHPRGILICNSGQGMCMAANRFKGIRAVLAHDKEAARSSRTDDDSNIICFPSEVVDKGDWQEILNIWLDTPFAGAPRFSRRIKQLDDLG